MGKAKIMLTESRWKINFKTENWLHIYQVQKLFYVLEFIYTMKHQSKDENIYTIINVTFTIFNQLHLMVLEFTIFEQE